MKDFFETVHHRASERGFLPDPVSPEQWDALLKAAMAAPSAVNMQPWEFVAIEERSMLDALAKALPYAKMALEAPAGLVVCAVTERAFEKREEYAVIDASLAAENFLLAVDALGLGAVWTALYPDPEREIACRRILGIPDSVTPLAFIPFGVPRAPTKPKDKYRQELVHRNRW